MQASRILRVCVVANWLILVVMVAASFFLESKLPTPLRDWIVAKWERDPTGRELIGFGIVAPFFGIYIVGGFGLLLLKQWGAWLFLVSIVGIWISNFFLGPTVEHAIPYALYEASATLVGFIVGLAFFSDALERPDEGADLSNLDL